MASKTGKKANAAAAKSNAPALKDDGRRFVVVRHDHARGRYQVYPGPGVMLAQAIHLARGLVEAAIVVPA